MSEQPTRETTNTPAIEVVDLVKHYPKAPVNAVDGVSFAVQRGEIFGLLGPNGAGKTTTIGVLTTSVIPTSGTARIMGHRRHRRPHRAQTAHRDRASAQQPGPQLCAPKRF